MSLSATVSDPTGVADYPNAGAVAIALDTRKVALIFQTALVLVIGLGVLREIVIAVIGTETVLKDLRHFTLDAERNLASWLESVCMVSAAALLAFHSLLDRERDRRNVFAWTLLSIVFILMSVDELVSFHEVSVKPLRNTLQLTGIFYYSWVLIAIPLVASLGLLLVPFLLRLERSTALRFILAGAVFVGGAVGTELICGYLATNGGVETPAYKFTAAAQEVIENIGMTMFVLALLRHIAIVTPAIRLKVTAS